MIRVFLYVYWIGGQMSQFPCTYEANPLKEPIEIMCTPASKPSVIKSRHEPFVAGDTIFVNTADDDGAWYRIEPKNDIVQ